MRAVIVKKRTRHFPLPPCGGGPGRGVAASDGVTVRLDLTADTTRAAPPSLTLPRKGGAKKKRIRRIGVGYA
jgi:hypothetical protein